MSLFAEDLTVENLIEFTKKRNPIRNKHKQFSKEYRIKS